MIVSLVSPSYWALFRSYCNSLVVRGPQEQRLLEVA